MKTEEILRKKIFKQTINQFLVKRFQKKELEIFFTRWMSKTISRLPFSAKNHLLLLLLPSPAQSSREDDSTEDEITEEQVPKESPTFSAVPSQSTEDRNKKKL